MTAHHNLCASDPYERIQRDIDHALLCVTLAGFVAGIVIGWSFEPMRRFVRASSAAYRPVAAFAIDDGPRVCFPLTAPRGSLCVEWLSSEQTGAPR